MYIFALQADQTAFVSRLCDLTVHQHIEAWTSGRRFAENISKCIFFFNVLRFDSNFPEAYTRSIDN